MVCKWALSGSEVWAALLLSFTRFEDDSRIVPRICFDSVLGSVLESVLGSMLAVLGSPG